MKMKILPIFFTYFLLLFAASAANAQGGVLPLNATVTGSVTSTTAVVYTVTTGNDGLLRLSLSTTSPTDLYMTLYDNDGTTQIGPQVESFNNTTVFIYGDGLAAGTYTVKVTPFSTSFGSFSLSDSLFTSGIANDIEPNGTAATALVVPQNGSATGHVGYYYNNLRDTADWYKVTTTADGLLRVYLQTYAGSIYSTTSSNPLDVNMTLYDIDGTTQLGAVEVFNGNGPATNFITKDGLAPGTYYVKIQPFSTNEFANYKVYDSLFTTSLANDIEPNGTAATALVLPQNGSKTGHVGYYYNNLRDTADWYKVTTTADGLLRVYLQTDSGGIYSTTSTNALDVNMTLYDNDGTTQLGAVEVFNGNAPATSFITKDGLAPGTYFVKIQPFSASEFANYKISDTLFTTPLANDVEPNGATATALVLPQNGSKTGHVGYYYNNARDTTDWYKVTTTANGMLRVYLTTDSGSVYSTTTTNPLDVNITLYDNDGTTQLGATEVFNGNAHATGLITADGLASGTYYVKVQPFSTSEFANYQISDSLFTTTVANDIEPNGARATAIVLPINASTTGNVGYYYNHARDTVDWYKVTTTADGLLRINLTTDSGSIHSTTTTNPLDVNLTLYDNDGTTQLGAVEVFNANAHATNQIIKDGLQPGTYYVKVQPFSTSEFSNYVISDSSILSTIPNDTEPNGSIVTATMFPANSNLKGHVGYYYNNQIDTADWYKLTTTTTGPLYITLRSARGNTISTSTNNPLDMVLTLYASDGTTQLGSVEVFNGNNPAEDSLVFASIAAGTYYVKVTNFSNSEFANYSLTNSRTIGGNLPVTFINFDGKLIDNQAELTWSTATELNNSGFQVEKSSDGQSFTAIGFIKGNGNSSSINTYNYNDVKVLSGYNYYRLKQVDLDGNFSYSSVIRLDFKNFAWKVFGNPVSANSWIQLQVAKTSNVAIQIISLEGKVMQTINKGAMPEGTYSIPLSLGNAAHGVYFVRLVVDNQIFSQKIIK